MPKLSLCMIVKEYTQQLSDTLKSLDPYIYDLHIVTQDKALVKDNQHSRKYGTVRDNSYVHYYEWQDDFAAARNFSFSKATGDVIFWIDSDDKVLHPEKLPELAKLITDGKTDVVHLEYLYEKDEFGNVRMRQWKPRLMRRGIGVWKKSVHEVWEPTQEVVNLMSEDVVIDHQHRGELHTKESGERNLRILMREFEQDKDKTDPRTLYYLGNTLMAMDRFNEALGFYFMHIKKCGWPEEKYFSMHYAAHCLKWLNRRDEAINIALEQLKLFPHWSLAYFTLGELYADKEDYNRAIEWLMTGLTKQKPDSKVYFTSDLDYTVIPMSRLAHSLVMTGEYTKALAIAERLKQENPDDPQVQQLLEIAKGAWEAENFVESFIAVANKIGNTDRIKASKLFDCLPTGLDEDGRIQAARFNLVPPKTWDSKSLVIYCGKGSGEEWAQPSIYQGIGGSEEAVIYMSEELTKLGYTVTVYNHCGDYRGTYNGVAYEPYYHFNSKDNFNILIAWRTPGLFNFDLRAKRKLVWLHDIAYPQQFNDTIIEQVDTFIFLSVWHRNNMPSIPDSKVFISNNGINPKDFAGISIAKEPNTLLWGSSYDRGLLPFIKNIFPLILKEIPDAQLHVAYGWNNIERLIQDQPGIYPDLEALYRELKPILDNHPNIVHHGRLSHKKLAELMGKSVVYPYASEFGETCNITSQKCQVADCVVITTRQAGGTWERVKHGTVLDAPNIYTNPKAQKQFAQTVIETLTHPSERYRHHPAREIMLKGFSWHTTAQTWEKGLLNGRNQVAEGNERRREDKPRGRQGKRVSKSV